MRSVAALLLLLAVLLSPSPALAEPPQRLAAQVTDAEGVIGNRAPVDDALAELQRETGIQLFVVFVDSFDGVTAKQWTDETARLSGLGDRDALLAVATGDRAYEYSFPPDSRLTDAELARVAERDIEPALSRSDWAGAVVAAAQGYRGATTGGGGGGGGGLSWAVLLIGLVLVAALVWVLLRRRRAAAAEPAPAPAGPTVPELSGQANALLIELDDDLRASERELALAAGQYGAAATEPFRAALESARQDVAEAFRLRMTLGDEPGPQDAGTLDRIIELCRGADARLDAESDAFDRLRDLEGRAAEVADAIDARRTALEAVLPGLEATVTDLRARYSGGAVTAIAGNVGQARERLAFAAQTLTQARAGLAQGGSRAEAALAVRAAEQATDQADQLVKAVERAAADLPAARTAADALLDEVTAEIAAGRAELDRGSAASGLAAAVAGGEQAVAEVRTALAAPQTDPVGAVARLQAADAALDTALAEARDAAERTARAHALLAQALPVARAEVYAANDFITTRRGAVDSHARAALSEAARHLAAAESLAGYDPVAALAEAEQARRLAENAGQQARLDVQSWGGGGFGSDAFAGAVLGGILAGGHGGGYGGGYGGGFGGGFGGGGWGGGFGGSGARARRGGGGGGGGRRGGGGRF